MLFWHYGLPSTVGPKPQKKGEKLKKDESNSFGVISVSWEKIVAPFCHFIIKLYALFSPPFSFLFDSLLAITDLYVVDDHPHHLSHLNIHKPRSPNSSSFYSTDEKDARHIIVCYAGKMWKQSHIQRGQFIPENTAHLTHLPLVGDWEAIFALRRRWIEMMGPSVFFFLFFFWCQPKTINMGFILCLI